MTSNGNEFALPKRRRPRPRPSTTKPRTPGRLPKLSFIFFAAGWRAPSAVLGRAMGMSIPTPRATPLLPVRSPLSRRLPIKQLFAPAPGYSPLSLRAGGWHQLPKADGSVPKAQALGVGVGDLVDMDADPRGRSPDLERVLSRATAEQRDLMTRIAMEVLK